ncbi:MAG: 50S ribosomal protein L9 [Propionibacteriaceae bacterium]|jgi:large subunit ribosomal protein L9|nr:50S ribosomal protein L9 [Propionibacteriaceae bacterium]
MKLILTTQVDSLGLAGDVVDVRPGYGRNYLLPTGRAIAWTRGAEKQIAGIQRARDAREIRGLDHANQVRAQLEALQIEAKVPAGQSGTLFGSLTPAAIALAVKAAGGPAVDKRSITIAKPIKTLGTHTVGIRLHDAVTAHVQVAVVAA